MKHFHKTMFLVYLFAYVQASPVFEKLPKEEIEESNSSKGENSLKAPSRANTNLIRNKRWWWSYVWTLICVVVVVAVVVAVGAVFTPLIGLGAAALAVKVLENTQAERKFLTTENTEKKWTNITGDTSSSSNTFLTSLTAGAAIIGAIVTTVIAGKGIANAKTTRSFDMPNEDKNSEDVAFDLKTIDIKINKNYENAVQMKQAATKMDPNLESQILVRKEGFQCDEELCREAGDGMHAAGICTPYHCKCEKEVAEGMKCEDDSIYDPVYQICDDPRHIKICGF